MSRSRMLLIGMLVVVLGATVGAVTTVLTSHSDARDQRIGSVSQVLVSADGMSLAVSTGCSSGAGTVIVVETTTTVTVGLPPPGPPINGICGIQSSTVRLKAPLGSRTLVDAATGKTVPAFSGSRILRPAHLPPGFTLAYDTANFVPTGGDEPSGPGCIQVYVKDGEYDDTLLIKQVVWATLDVPDGVVATPVKVRGRDGSAFPGEIEWLEDGQLITVESMTYAYAVLPTTELIAIANSLG